MLNENVKQQLETAATGMRQTLEESVSALRADPKMLEIIETQRNLNQIEGMLGRPKTSLAELFGLEPPREPELEMSGATVELGEYYKIKPLEAARRYLKKKGKAATLDEIVTAIRAGGCTVNAANLRKTLTKAVWQVAKVGPDAFGLVEFYPHIARGRKKRTEAAASSTQETEAVGTEEQNGDDGDDEESDEEDS